MFEQLMVLQVIFFPLCLEKIAEFSTQTRIMYVNTKKRINIFKERKWLSTSPTEAQITCGNESCFTTLR